MSAPIGRAATKIAQAATKSAAKAPDAVAGKDGVLRTGAKRDPELYILLSITAATMGIAGYHLARKPTSASSEASVSMAEGTMPWQVESSKGDEPGEQFKYKYHPGGDKKKGLKDAPSALNTVIVPNVTLTKAQHDKFNKWGKEGY